MKTIERIIEKEIYVNASSLVSELLQDEGGKWLDELLPCIDGPDYDEAPDGYTVAQVGHDPEEWSFANWDMSTMDEGFATEREAIEAAWNDSGEEPPRREALQHWIVSDWLADKLEAIDALIVRDVLGFNIWGRTDCGQSLELNHELRQVAESIDNA